MHRHLHDKLGSAYANASEVEQWKRERSRRPRSDRATRGPSDQSSRRMLAVLPFESLSAPGDGFFSAGLTEELITQIGRLHADALGVIARTSVMRFKGANRSIGRVRDELGVDYVLEGSVRRQGDRLRVAVQLIDTADETHLWAEAYERSVDDVFDVQVAIARSVAEKVGIHLSPVAGEIKPLHLDADAYEYYLQGRFHWYKLSKVHSQTAIDYFQLALERDSRYAAAYAGIAAVWAVRGDCGFAPPAQAYAEAKSAAARACELDETLAESHDVLGRILFYWDWRFQAAEREFRRAITCNPSYADVRLMLWDLLISTGRPLEAEAQLLRCLELDPYNAFFRCFQGWHLLYVGQFAAAVEALERALRTDPHLEAARLGLWGALFRVGDHDRAVTEATRFLTSRGDEAVAQKLGVDYRRHGYAGAMRRAADRLATLSRRRYVGALRVARLYAHSADHDRALHWLETAFQQREPGVVHMRVSWDWLDLRDKPRFHDLLKRL